MNVRERRLKFPAVLGPAREGLSIDEVAIEAEDRVRDWTIESRRLTEVGARISAAGEVGEHRVCLSRSWIADGELPGHVRSHGSVTRGDCFDLAAECAKTGQWLPLLRLSYAWGTGPTGYGSHRWGAVGTTRKKSQPPPAIEHRLAGAVSLLTEAGSLHAYFHLNNLAAGRIHRLGPAFFTKFLYFAGGPQRPDGTDQPLVLDAVLARAIRRLSADDVPLPSGGFTTPHYALYLAIMRRLANDAGPAPVSPDVVELALFGGTKACAARS